MASLLENKSVLKEWDITEQELTKLVHDNPSLRGMMLGYIAEYKFEILCLNNPKITESVKDDDHDRTKKGDRRIVYKDKTFIIEVKSLQTKMTIKTGDDEWEGKAQVDGSDRRIIQFDDGTELNTTLLKRGEFDILAINCFGFGNKWRFLFCKNKDLPTSTFSKYTPEQQKHLIASLIAVKWPPEPPFTDDIFQLLDELL
jgi:hypothetical protein